MVKSHKKKQLPSSRSDIRNAQRGKQRAFHPEKILREIRQEGKQQEGSANRQLLDERQNNRNRRTLTGKAFKRDFTPMGFDQVLDNRQSQAGS